MSLAPWPPCIVHVPLPDMSPTSSFVSSSLPRCPSPFVNREISPTDVAYCRSVSPMSFVSAGKHRGVDQPWHFRPLFCTLHLAFFFLFMSSPSSVSPSPSHNAEVGQCLLVIRLDGLDESVIRRQGPQGSSHVRVDDLKTVHVAGVDPAKSARNISKPR